MKKLRVSCLIFCLALTACGGGGGGNASDIDADPWQQRTAASDKLANVCADPRSGRDPYNNNQPYPDKPGSISNEKNWIRSYLGEVYLWYDEIPNISAAPYTAPNYLGSVSYALASYFYDLLTPARTNSGKLKDQFSFVYPSDLWNQLSQDGIVVDYGAAFSLAANAVYVTYVGSGTPSAQAGLGRGDALLQIDDVPVSQLSTDAIYDALYPSVPGEQHSFVVRDRGDTATHRIALIAAEVTTIPVPVVDSHDTATGTVGYLLFNDHVATSEGQLIDAIAQLKTAGIDDLVLDLRYNGGGFLDIAAELSFMIAGSGATTGKTFERLNFSNKNPLKNSDGVVTPFHATAIGFDDNVTAGTALPQLGLSRVFLLVGSGTCSASEAIINGLRGIDLEVVLIGDTTCGKPYGFYSQDNCGLSYFAIEFSGVNQKGFGDYADGFNAQCAVDDDFSHDLGDPQEALFAAALQYRISGQCPVSAKRGTVQAPMKLIRSPLRENRYYRRR